MPIPALALPVIKGFSEAAPFLLAGLLGGGEKKKLEKEGMRLDNQARKFQLSELQRLQPAQQALFAAILGRLPTHMKQFFPQGLSVTPPVYSGSGDLLRGPRMPQTSGNRVRL